MTNRLFRKEGAFGVAVFANERLTLDELDEAHLVYKRDIKRLWQPKPVLYQADSFLFVKDDTLDLFFELQHWDDPGAIAMVKTRNLKSWTEPVVVLRQPFHLSTPSSSRRAERCTWCLSRRRATPSTSSVPTTQS